MKRHKDAQTALVLDIQRLSTEDGPGLRTTVFLKGCNLRCVWCHNPESISGKQEVEWFHARCMGCGQCVHVCPQHAVKADGQGITIDRKKCKACGVCVQRCPTLAMEMKGRAWDAESLAAEVLKDRNYFGTDGGVTASGGECLLHGEFVTEFFRILKEENIHTALDTAGMTDQSTLEAVLKYTDLVLLDLKVFERDMHQKYTGVDNAKIFQNASFIAEYCSRHPQKKLWVRTPVIPGYTDTDNNIHFIGKYIAEYMQPYVQRWELLAFNNLCKDKYDRLDKKWELEKQALLRKGRMERLMRVALESGVDEKIVRWSGATKEES